MFEKAISLADAALGTFLGACVGDAAGAVLEFMGRRPTTDDVAHALTMPGGGIWQVAPGQITDDCELGLSLADALAQSSEFNLEQIAQSYARWIESEPFDIGTTTIRALGSFQQRPWRDALETQGYAVTMTSAAAALCMESKSNGSLMRASPLAIWGYRHEPGVLAKFAQQDSCLSHPNPSCWQAVACYVIAIAHLLNHLGDRVGAFMEAETWATHNANTEVQEWLADAREGRHVAYGPHIGFVRIGFSHAFRHLWAGSSYLDAVKETLAGGGDTDTNACIVGGLIGAASGACAIPEKMRAAVLECEPSQGRLRPSFLQPRRVPELVARLCAI